MTAPALTPEELDEACRLASTVLARGAAARKHESSLARAVLALRSDLDHATAHDGDWLSKESRRMCETILGERDALRDQVRALRDERDRLREEVDAVEENALAIGDGVNLHVMTQVRVAEQQTAEAIAAYVRPTGDQAPKCCDDCARRWEILRDLADEIRRGDWRRPTPEKPATGTTTEDDHG